MAAAALQNRAAEVASDFAGILAVDQADHREIVHRMADTSQVARLEVAEGLEEPEILGHLGCLAVAVLHIGLRIARDNPVVDTG